MKKQHDKVMADLQRLLATQDFKSEAEMEKFIAGIIGEKIPSFPNEALSFEEQAQDLVFDAYDLSPAKGRRNIEKALELDPNCISAFEYLAATERSIEIAIVFLQKAISIGKHFFGGEYLKKNKGMFWGLHETRPYMCCLRRYADCLYVIGDLEASIRIFEEMIELNPNDNQGIRNQLLLYLVETGDINKFKKYDKMFEESTETIPSFNRALFAFKTEGETESAKNKLLIALKQNKFVADKLLFNKTFSDMSDTYSPGNEDEANYYVINAKEIWMEIPGAMDWLKKHSQLK